MHPLLFDLDNVYEVTISVNAGFNIFTLPFEIKFDSVHIAE